LHQKRVAFAKANGRKAAARAFGGSRNTVRTGLCRPVPGKPSALAELSRRPGGRQRPAPPANRLRRRTPPIRVRPARQPQRHRPPPPPTPTHRPPHEKARHQTTPAPRHTPLATLWPALHRHQILAGHPRITGRR